MQLSSLIFGKGRRDTMLFVPEMQDPTATTTANASCGGGGEHFEDLLGLKTLADQSSLSSIPPSSCVTRKLLPSAPSLPSTSSSSTSYCSSSLSCSSSFSSLSSLGSENLCGSMEAVAVSAVESDRGFNKNAEEEEDRKEELDEGEEDEEEEACWGTYGPRDGARRFPPPIHMPRILMRKYDDAAGRLVIRVVNIKHHEFFWSHRSNGRLTLKFIHMHKFDEDLTEDKDHEDLTADIETEEKDDDEDEGGDKNPSSVALPISPPSLQPLLFEKDDNTRIFTKIQLESEDSRNPTGNPATDVRHEYSMGTLASSMPESTMLGGIGGVGNGCFINGRSTSLFQIPAPMVHLVRS